MKIKQLVSRFSMNPKRSDDVTHPAKHDFMDVFNSNKLNSEMKF